MGRRASPTAGAAGPAEGPRFEGQAALLDVGEGADDDRPDEGQEAAEPGAEAALGVKAASSLALADDPGSLHEPRYGLDGRPGHERPRGRAAPPFQVDDERPWVGRHH